MVEKSGTSSAMYQKASEFPLSQTLTALKSSNKRVKRRALEFLAFHFVWSIDLDFKGWFLRSADSNDIEVGIVADDSRMSFARWLIQCRNAHQTDMGEIATAVGRSVSFKPNVLLSVTNGHFTQQVRHYATRVMQLTNFRILLIDACDLNSIVNGEATIKSILSRETEQIRAAKELQVALLYA